MPHRARRNAGHEYHNTILGLLGLRRTSLVDFGQSIAGIDQVVLQIVGLRLQQLHYQLRRSLFLSISLSSTPSPAEPHLFISGPHAGVSTSHFHFSLPDWLRNGGCFQTDKLSPFPPFKVIETLLSLPIASISFIVICFCAISFPP